MQVAMPPHPSTPMSGHHLANMHLGDPSRFMNYRNPITNTASHSRSTVPMEDSDDDLPYNDSPEDEEVGDEEDVDEEEEEMRATPPLKGVHWPGMSIFDSADAIGRRRRNQKKGADVLQLLEAHSLNAKAIEQLWTPNGSLQREKPITGLPSSSPLVSPEELPVNIERPPLGQLGSRRSNANQAGPTRYAAYTDQRLEEALTYGNHDTQSRKRTLGVYHDEPEPLTGTFNQPSTQTTSASQKNSRQSASTSLAPEAGLDTTEDDFEHRRRVRKRKLEDGQYDRRELVRQRLESVGRPPSQGSLFNSAPRNGNGRPSFPVNDENADRKNSRITFQSPNSLLDSYYAQQNSYRGHLPRLPLQNQRQQHRHSVSVESMLNDNGYIPTSHYNNPHHAPGPTHGYALPTVYNHSGFPSHPYNLGHQPQATLASAE